MKQVFLFLFVLSATLFANAQKLVTTSGVIVFDATTKIDQLPKAENKTVIAAIDPAKGTIQFEASMRNFAFKNPMMQDHFNSEKWMDSENFPKASFKGNITNIDEVSFKKEGTYTANVEGVLTIKGKESKVSTPATIVVNNGLVKATANFSIKLEDYGIDGAPVAAGKVSKEPVISVNCEW